MDKPQARPPLVTTVLLAVLLTPAITACQGAADRAGANGPQQESVMQFTPPASATRIERYNETGIDALMLLAFEAPAPDAVAFADNLIPGGVRAGQDPGNAYLGAGKPWWFSTFPEGASGGSAEASGVTTQVVLGPEADGKRKVWASRFTR